MQNPHDTLFHEALSSPIDARGFLAGALPGGLSAHLDWESLESLPATSKGIGKADAHADLVFRVGLRDLVRPLHLVVEHKSHVDRRVVVQVHGYCARILGDLSRSVETDDGLPLLVALVVYHGPRAWAPEVGLRDLYALPDALAPHLEPFLPGFRFLFEDLALLTDDQLANRGLTDWCHVAIDTLRRGAGPGDLGGFFRSLRDRVHRLAGSSLGAERLSSIYAYLAHVRGLPRAEMAAIIRRELGREQEEHMQSTYDQIYQEGRAEGLDEGRDEGRQQGLAKGLEQGREQGLEQGRGDGLRDAVRAVLSARFGGVPEVVADALQRAGADQLRAAVSRVALVERSEDLLSDLGVGPGGA